jgi:hypothetical protein
MAMRAGEMAGAADVSIMVFYFFIYRVAKITVFEKTKIEQPAFSRIFFSKPLLAGQPLSYPIR